MRVVELWRFPVKSLQGEQLTEAGIGPEGIEGDRQWALFDLDTGYGLTARRVPDLLFAAGRLRPDGGAEVVLPDGTVTSDDTAISAWLGRRVTLRAAGSAPGRPRYESPDDDLAPTPARWHDWQGAPGPSTTTPTAASRWSPPARWGSGTGGGSAPTSFWTARESAA